MRKFLLIFSIVVTTIAALADTPPPNTVSIKGGTDGTKIGNVADALKVTSSVSPNSNATLSARQTVTASETFLTAPANAVSVIIECESGNADNLRWGFSNSNTAILSSTLGMLCEPGRSENIPVGAGSYLHMISTGVGSDFMDVQWVLTQ